MAADGCMLPALWSTRCRPVRRNALARGRRRAFRGRPGPREPVPCRSRAMPRKVVGGLIQGSDPINDESVPVEKIKQAMFDKHVPLIEEAGRKGVQILCLQEIFNGPYFCPGQDQRWYDAAESVPGPTTEAVARLAAMHK